MCVIGAVEMEDVAFGDLVTRVMLDDRVPIYMKGAVVDALDVRRGRGRITLFQTLDAAFSLPEAS